MTTYHLVPAGKITAACVLAGTGTIGPGDHLVGDDEAKDPNGRYFNCPACHATLTGGRAHVLSPDGWDEDLGGSNE